MAPEESYNAVFKTVPFFKMNASGIACRGGNFCPWRTFLTLLSCRWHDKTLAEVSVCIMISVCSAVLENVSMCCQLVVTGEMLLLQHAKKEWKIENDIILFTGRCNKIQTFAEITEAQDQMAEGAVFQLFSHPLWKLYVPMKGCKISNTMPLIQIFTAMY